MNLEDVDRKQAIEKAESVAICLKEKSDEDAFYHLLDLMYSMYRWEVGSRSDLEEAVKRAGRRG